MVNTRHSYVRFFPSDWLAGTARMTRLHKSIYFDICCFQWDQGVPCPASALPLMLGDLPNWRELVDDLVAAGKLVRSDDGSLANTRALDEAARAFGLWEKKSLGGKKGAAQTNGAKSGSGVGSGVGSDDGSVAGSDDERGPGLPPQNQNQNQIKKEGDVVDVAHTHAHEDGEISGANVVPISGKLIPVTDTFALSDRLCRAAGVRNIDPSRITANRAEVERWLELGADVEADIIPVIEKALMASSEPIYSLKYFDPAVRRTVARREGKHHAAERGHDPAAQSGNAMARAAARRIAERNGGNGSEGRGL